MSWELLTETPPLLREGFLVRFVGGWPSHVDNKVFAVVQQQVVKYDIGRIVAANTNVDLDFRAPAAGGVNATQLSLLPESTDALYEILASFKGHPIVYPRYANLYYHRLQTTNVQPDTDNERLRYLGALDEDDSPWDAPRLREHTVKDQEPPVLRVRTDWDLDDKLVTRLWVNVCRILTVDVTGGQGGPSQDQLARARTLRYHKSYLAMSA